MRKVLSRLAVCVAFFSCALYTYLKEQNRATALRMQIPQLMKEIEAIEEQNCRLQYQIVTFESPEHLLTLSKEPAYAHLQFPFASTIVQAREGLALQAPQDDLVSDKKGQLTPLAVAK